MEGVVVKTSGQLYRVLSNDGSLVECNLKGNFRLKSISTTNPIVVGDHVCFEKNAHDIAMITAIKPRINEMVRRASNLSKQAHIIAANIDLAVLVVTTNYPKTYSVFIDRFLVAAESFKIRAIIVINKIDLYHEDELSVVEQWQTLYQSIGYPCYAVSAESGEGISTLHHSLIGKISLFSGNSGVGKSSLLNRLSPDSAAKTNAISEYHNKGMHTTTFSEMFPLEGGGFVIDTPGIKGFGMTGMSFADVSHYFPEIFKIASDCRFYNCTHTHEPGCAVIEAVQDGRIDPSRYTSYLSILDEFEKGKYR
ncbi:ribosome small subunit-dependent GTPase A [Microbacter margulisiae]|uniref:Small ribosomal subunit biogenesis GTPase RsgA n=1 Tax=Microbacter margulisiae TaxID=1350067 RepID=A0A7W5H378_9PORP|nr:ribosome small subunit-dependent GTPase A [Microbacter margulisiae]MBB3188211.1 ribosome biogenesis GTPase [Microbacter margulisiae]